MFNGGFNKVFFMVFFMVIDGDVLVFHRLFFTPNGDHMGTVQNIEALRDHIF